MTREDELVTRARSRVGRTLRGKYELVALLGVGGMAAVYSARHLRNANRVAVKILHPEIALDPTLRGRFLREGYAANSVDHPGTVRVLDDDTAEDGCAFLVMELLEGETLEARAERCGGRLGVPEVVTVASALLAVLHAAHQKGIVHRDIKPENVFVTRAGVLKVLDFGVARVASEASRTRSGSVFGTPAFMPPEQALGRAREVDALSDVWAAGATMFTLLSGRLVHEAETAEETLVYAATRPARRLASVAPHVPARVAAIVDRAVEFDRGARWPSALAMLQALERAAKEERAASRVSRFDDPERTDVAAPPAMTLAGTNAPPARPMADATTVPATAKPALSTVAGVATQGDASDRSATAGRRSRARLVALVAPLVMLGGATILVVARGTGRPAASTAPAVTAAPAVPAASSAPPPAPPETGEELALPAEAPFASALASSAPAAAPPPVRRPPVARAVPSPATTTSAPPVPTRHDPLAP